MHYIASISLDRFYAKTLTQAQPELKEQPLVIHHDKAVLDINEKAEKAGAKIGMALSEAKALLHGGNFVKWEEEPYREAQEAWLEVCNDFTDIIEPDRQHSAYLDFSGHPDVTDIVWKLQKALESRLGWHSRIGVAASKWIAKVAERVNGDGELPCPYLEPCEFPIRFLAPLPTNMLLPVKEADRMRLRFLGYRKIGEVAEIPLAVLRDQFGEAGLLIHQAAHGGVQQKVRALYPKDCVAARMRFEGALESKEGMNEALFEIAKDLGEALQEKDLQGNEIELRYEPEEPVETRFVSLRRKFMKPMQSAKTILPSLKLLAAPIDIPIVEIRTRMSNLQPAQRFQRKLDGAHAPEERAAGTVAAFNHIRTVFGDHAIEVAGERKEPRRRLVLKAWKDATGWS